MYPWGYRVVAVNSPRRFRSRTSRTLLAGALAAGLLLGACSSGSSEAAGTAATGTEAAATGTPQVAVPASATIIDVRTAEEFASGHLEGAVNLDLTSGRLEAELPSLDPSATYFVYCRTGNRSATATALMVDAGFTEVTDLGGVEDAAASTGIAVVR